MPEPFYEPENQTACPDNGDGKHSWIWNEEQQDWQCDACGVWESRQED